MHERDGVTNGVINGHTPVELWRHPDPRNTRMWAFKGAINSKYDLDLQTYDDLYQWSIENIPQLWAETWSFVGVEASQPFKKVGHSQPGHVTTASPFPQFCRTRVFMI
jgi:hypothetical protein